MMFYAIAVVDKLVYGYLLEESNVDGGSKVEKSDSMESKHW